MNVRTRETTVTFDHAFHLSEADGDLPAGTYRLVIDEEQLLGVSFLAYRRMATMLHTPALAAPPGRNECLSVNAAELDAALLKDQQTSARAREAPSADALLL
ncbi:MULTISPECIES: hypothetical protein [Xanthobacter]|uniref:Uncharacterized protein n=1 Tax=Xanthobacter flavus TaxID=281 RepID=A0A9W6CPK3_XANFL|nr:MULTISPECIES: hypothetical protein [Xanthobacter]MDR6334989.1 hypothetical protein [Xanthobacter flavus]NMN60380.1 hypothetical protein [Xanthobacter sp. SG618]UDQ87200.1 hypothetical protein LJE71_12800 [Xanthobacter autotrophicus]UJX44084.1 hypothetical protein D7006_04600 [Xanthobacter sp. YC-JY1]GLI23787.1 hypothetical protein XFLAVUS301_34610 [Xanthobacter flavus]